MNTKPGRRADVKPSRRSDDFHSQAERHHRRQRDDRARREAALIPIVCVACDIDLVEAPIGSEARCPSCGSWTKADGHPTTRVT